MADYYTATSDPADNTDAEPLVLRTEHASIAAGFAKIAAYTGNASKIVAINSAGTAQEAITTTGTGNGVRATSPTLVTPLLGTPTSGVLTNCTGYPASALAGLGTGVATFLATPSSANLAAAITDETGSGALVFATSPTLTTPVLGVASATSINKVAITAPATSATLTIADGKTLTASNTLTFAGTDGSTLNIGTGGTLGALALLSAVGTSQITDANVTYAKIQNVTDARLLGRSAGSTGAPQEITVGSGLSLSAGSLTATGLSAASQAQVQAESSDTVAMTPSNMKYRLGSVDPSTKFEFYEDFEHEVTAGSVFGKSAWTITSGALSIIAGTGGVARFSDSGANMDIPLRSSTTSLPWITSKNPILKCRMANYGATGGIRRIALTSASPDGTAIHGVQLTWTPGANLFLRVRAGGAESTLDSGVVMETGGTFHTAKVVVTGTTSVELFVDGVSKGTVTTNIATAAMGLWIMLTGSAAANGIDCDYIQIVQDR